MAGFLCAFVWENRQAGELPGAYTIEVSDDCDPSCDGTGLENGRILGGITGWFRGNSAPRLRCPFHIPYNTDSPGPAETGPGRFFCGIQGG